MIHALLLALALADSPNQSGSGVDCNHAATASVIPALKFPDAAKGVVHGEVTVLVSLSLDDRGKVAQAVVTKSSGNASIDSEALRQVRNTTYAPKVVECKPVVSTYTYRVDFSSDAPGDAPTPVPPGVPCFRDVQTISVTQPEFPASAAATTTRTVTVLVEVIVDEYGKVQSLRIKTSSGSLALDDAAMRAANATTYSPKIVNCKPVSGTYVFRADFSPG